MNLKNVLITLFLLAAPAARADGVALQVQKGPGAGQVTLSWTGDLPPYGVYRATSPVSVEAVPNLVGTAGGSPWIESPPAGSLFYLVTPVPATPVCGNGAREAGEQCDDGNLVNMDGCDAACR